MGKKGKKVGNEGKVNMMEIERGDEEEDGEGGGRGAKGKRKGGKGERKLEGEGR